MSEIHTTNISLSTDLVRELQAQACQAGMSLESYLALMARSTRHGHDAEFLNAARHLFSKFPNALRRLAE